MIKIDFITGFLGAGKTTFLLKYAKYLMGQGLRIGILEYDYGAINVDMVLLNELRGENCELEMLAAACDADCLKRRFKTKLISMAMSGYDRVIVEPSGVFDMDMFFDDLREQPLENWYEIGSVLAVVNANLAKDLSKEEDFFLASQAACAGKLVFSRTQLVDEEQMKEVKEHILRAAKQIHCEKLADRMQTICFEKNWDELTERDFDVLSRAGYHVGDYAKTVAVDDTDITSLYFLNLEHSKDWLEKIIEELFESHKYGEIIRLKGFVETDNGGMQVNATAYERTIVRSDVSQSALIVIGRNLKKEEIEALIAE